MTPLDLELRAALDLLAERQAIDPPAFWHPVLERDAAELRLARALLRLEQAYRARDVYLSARNLRATLRARGVVVSRTRAALLAASEAVEAFLPAIDVPWRAVEAVAA